MIEVIVYGDDNSIYGIYQDVPDNTTLTFMREICPVNGRAILLRDGVECLEVRRNI